MKRTWFMILTAALLLCLPMTALATENATLSADTVRANAGETVTVPIRLAGNPGFTNFAVSLEYDKDQLTLVSLNTESTEGNAYLCGTLTAGNPEWETEAGTANGYLTGASAETVTGDGILFTATFRLAADFSGPATVKPVLHYLRNGGEAGFADVTVTAKAGSVSSAVLGDVNGDGRVTLMDAVAIYNAVMGGDADSSMDINGDGRVTLMDAVSVYNLVMGG